MAQAMTKTKREIRTSRSPRGKNALHFETDDNERISEEIKRVKAETVLEFGPGDSTQAMLDMGIKRIVTCENINKWFLVAKKRFKNEKRVTILRFYDEMPCRVDGLGENERFDLGFVDAPKGFNPARKIHEGFSDCSRLNTLLYALQRCKVVLLHDATRPLERATLFRVWATGLVDIDFIPNKLGMARITPREKQNGPHSQDAKKPRRSADGAKPKRRRKPADKRPDRCDPSGTPSEECVLGND